MLFPFRKDPSQQPPGQHLSYVQPTQITAVRIRQTLGKTFIFFAVSALVIAIGITTYLVLRSYSLAAEISALTTKKEDLKKTFTGPQNANLLDQSNQVVHRASDLATILDNRIKWTKILALINDESLRLVSHTNISATSERSLTLSGQVADYESLAKALRVWQSSEIVDSLEIGAFNPVGTNKSLAEGESAGLDFTLNIDLKEDLFPEKYRAGQSQTLQAIDGTAPPTDTPAAPAPTPENVNNPTQ